MAENQTIQLIIDGREYQVVVGDLAQHPVRVLVDGRAFLVEMGSGRPAPASGARTPAVEQRPEVRDVGRGAAFITTNTEIVAPMPGNIVKIQVKAGQYVERGDIVCYLEAMKMNNAIHAPRAGVIKDVAVTEGQVVAHRQALIRYAD
jgi:biotin carboxyl carrier protein